MLVTTSVDNLPIVVDEKYGNTYNDRVEDNDDIIKGGKKYY